MKNFKELEKFEGSKINPDNAIRVINYLKEKLDNLNDISDRDIEDLLSFQDEDGGFKLTTNLGLHSEAALDFYWTPSYLATLILINKKLEGADIDLKTIDKALDFCTKNQLAGHGYDSFEEVLNNLILFGKYNIIKFYNTYPDSSASFKNMLDFYVDDLEKRIQAKAFYGLLWGGNYKEKILKAHSLLKATYYVAYGSNINIDRMKKRCPGASPVATTLLKDYKLHFDYYLNVKNVIGAETPVVIWRITENDEKNLDRYEGVPNNIYRKEYIDLEIKGVNRKCLIYIMNDIPDRKNVSPSEQYLNTCLKGYKDFNLDEKYLFEALKDNK